MENVIIIILYKNKYKINVFHRFYTNNPFKYILNFLQDIEYTISRNCFGYVKCTFKCGRVNVGIQRFNCNICCIFKYLKCFFEFGK